MNSVYRYSTLLICLPFVIASYGQLNSGNLTQYTEKDGLPGVQVSSLLIDRFGYVWAGTINGLVRYDGYEFKRFYSNPNDTASIHGLPVYSLFEDHTGQIWIGTGPSFLNVYDPVYKTFKQYPFRDLISHPANVEPDVVSVCEDNNGRIYIGVDTYSSEPISSALLYKDEKDDTLKVFPAPDSLAIQNVLSLQKDPSGNIWCISYSGVFKIDTKGNLTRTGFSLYKEMVRNHDVPKDARFDKQGNVWIITGSDRLYEFNPATDNYKSWLPDINTASKNASLRKAIAIDKDDNVWLATDDGVKYFNRKTNQFSSFNNGIKKELEHVQAIELKFDSFGTLWIGTNADGLIRNENRPQLKSYVFNKADKNSITPGWASAVYEATDGKVWILTTGSGESGINILDTSTGRIVQARSSSLSAKNPGIFSIWENAPGEFYLGTFQGTYGLSNKTYNIKPVILPGVPNPAFVRSHFTDSRGNEWLCTPLGMYKRDRDSIQFKQYDLSKVHGGNAASNTVTNVYEGKNNGLWLLTDNGLYLYDYKTGSIERHGYDEQSGDVFMSQDINSLYEDNSGIAWVGTWQGGLSRYDVKTKKIRTYTQEDGLPSMCIQSIIADEKNNALWLSTFDGLSRFDLKTGQFINFSVADGIQGQLFADGAGLKTSTGSFLFGGSNGITIFDPNEINQTSIPPKVFLTDLKLFNKPVIPGSKSFLRKPIDETSSVILPYNQNTLSIEFTALHYSNPLKNRYSYKLDNYDNEWRDIGNQHVAFYPKLSPGEYVFHVKAANDKGVWNETGATLTIIINPPWWQTTWAYVLYAVLLVGIGLAVNSYVRRRLLEKEREKSRARELEQAREIERAYYKLEETHEALKAAQARLIQSEKMVSLGELTAGIAHEIQNPLNFMNNFSEVNKDMIDELQIELKAGNVDQAIRISTDIKENEEKINHHGMRADAIVKGMLQHSRISTGVEEPTDINKLADDFLRLAYHGMRAKNKNFNADIKTAFDTTLDKVNVVPQDIGRVLLNLLNNAFYAVNEKFTANRSPFTADYTPTISIQTKKLSDKIEIKVSDNGNGIPQNIVDKIFQPFFTTKPTGQGTGLGLSLAYDIIKAHGGEIKVLTKDGEGSEFIIHIPITPL